MASSSWNTKNPRILADAAGGIAPVYEFPEGSSQSYKAGALVYLEASSGQITIVTDSTTLIAGIVLEDASTTQTTLQKVQIVRPGDRMVFTCYDASDAAETAADNFKAGLTYDIEEISGVSYAEVDSAHATTEELHFIQAVYDAAGASTNQGIFSVETNALNFARSA
jgi:hypothetical protein